MHKRLSETRVVLKHVRDNVVCFYKYPSKQYCIEKLILEIFSTLSNIQ